MVDLFQGSMYLGISNIFPKKIMAEKRTEYQKKILPVKFSDDVSDIRIGEGHFGIS